ncbi:MAG: MBL fold metallo-hydrolase [Chloroflexi bacterium]|nr:MBL fold metallo-hydrolase [Chloroflexota bacterium]
MEIVWLGHSCFRIRGREAVVVTDPCPPSTGYSLSKVTADVVTLSHDHDDHTYLKAVTGQRMVVRGPGEYEVEGAFFTGITTYHDGRNGAVQGKNLAFVIEMEEISVCHLGDLGHTPTPDQVEEMTGVDVLLIPVGGHTTIDGAAAAEVVSLLEPKLVVPMHYQTDSAKVELDPLNRFLKEMGINSFESQPKLTLTKSSLPEETQVVVLDYKR